MAQLAAYTALFGRAKPGLTFCGTVEYYLPEIYEEYLVYRKMVHHTPYRKRKQIKRVLAAFHDYLKRNKKGLRSLKIDHIDAFQGINMHITSKRQRYYLFLFVFALFGHRNEFIQVEDIRFVGYVNHRLLEI